MLFYTPVWFSEYLLPMGTSAAPPSVSLGLWSGCAISAIQVEPVKFFHHKAPFSATSKINHARLKFGASSYIIWILRYYCLRSGSNHDYCIVYRTFQKGRAIQNYSNSYYSKASSKSSYLLRNPPNSRAVSCSMWDRLEPQMICSLSDGTKISLEYPWLFMGWCWLLILALCFVINNCKTCSNRTLWVQLNPNRHRDKYMRQSIVMVLSRTLPKKWMDN